MYRLSVTKVYVMVENDAALCFFCGFDAVAWPEIFDRGCVNLWHSFLSIPVQLPYQVGRTIKKRHAISYRLND